jgi:hypothetical protein
MPDKLFFEIISTHKTSGTAPTLHNGCEMRMNTQNVNAVLSQILLSANQLENAQDREIGTSHIINYLYLADFFYAEHDHGQILTGIPWRSSYYGPWNTDIYDYLGTDLSGAARTYNPKKSQGCNCDTYIWHLADSDSAMDCVKGIDEETSLYVSRQVQKYSNRTSALHDFISETPPMLRAMPNELLSFEPSDFFTQAMQYDDDGFPKNLKPSQKEELRKWVEDSRKVIKDRIDEIMKERASNPVRQVPPPVYDEVFIEGMRAMNASGMINIPPGIYTVEIKPLNLDIEDMES